MGNLEVGVNFLEYVEVHKANPDDWMGGALLEAWDPKLVNTMVSLEVVASLWGSQVAGRATPDSCLEATHLEASAPKLVNPMARVVVLVTQKVSQKVGMAIQADYLAIELLVGLVQVWESTTGSMATAVNHLGRPAADKVNLTSCREALHLEVQDQASANTTDF
jgi:hypothetical protein